MKKHLCLICTVMSVVLTTLLSGCNDGSLSETSSALTFSESTSSIFINSDNTSSEKVNSNVETSSKASSTQKENTSSKASSTQKEETSSSNSTSTTSKISVDRTPSSQNSSDTASKKTPSEETSSITNIKDISEPPIPVKTLLGYDVYGLGVNAMDFVTKVYSENELNENTFKEFKTIKELDEKFPVESLKVWGEYYAAFYRGKQIFTNDYGAIDCIYRVAFNSNGDFFDVFATPYFATKEQFENLSVGQTMADVLKIHPSVYISPRYDTYPWMRSAAFGRISKHYTSDGYSVYIMYSIPEADADDWENIPYGKLPTMELYERLEIEKIDIVLHT